MNPVAPEELSALMDGELEAGRAREVEIQIAADPALRRAFEALSRTDAAWRTAAATAIFAPDIILPATEYRPGWLAASAVLMVALLALRMAPKLVGSPVFGFGLHAISLPVLLAVLVWLSHTDSRHDIASPI